MALIVEQKFVNKYRQQYYQDGTTIQQLQKEQKMLYKLLNDLYTKVNKSFEKVCDFAEKRNLSQRNSENIQNKYKLPCIIAEAQLRNSQTYRQVLENQKKKLQIRVKKSENIKQQDLNMQIRAEKHKLASLMKRNRTQQLEIKKLGQKLVSQNKSPHQIYSQLYSQLKTKRTQNEQKQQNIIGNQQKIKNLREKIQQIQPKIGNLDQEDQTKWQQQQTLKNENRLKTLQSNRDKIKQNIQSFKTRISQQYYCKLKQLEAITAKSQQLDHQLYSLKLKVCDKKQQLSKSLLIP